MIIVVHLCLLFLIFLPTLYATDFSPATTDYNAYGLKIAANDLMIVEAQNDLTQFLIRFQPFSDNIAQISDRSCWYEYDDSSRFVYTVAIGKNQSTYSFFFVGEMTGLSEDTAVANRIFVGIITYTGPPMTINCDTGFTISIQYVTTPYVHQQRLVMVTDPFGLVAYGISEQLTFVYRAATNSLIVHLNNSLSLSSTFIPCAVDYYDSSGIIAGFQSNGRNERVKFSATVILFNMDSGTAVATPIQSWIYPTNGGTWQAGDANAGADQYTAKYDMSVSINTAGTQALVGIQSMNTVFLFGYTNTTLILVSSKDNGRGIGFGKGVAWLSDTFNSIAILANIYSIKYVWSSSNIHIYDSTLTSTSTPASIFPNIQQQLYIYMSSVFLNIVTTPNHLVLLDNQGGLFVFLSAPNGYYASTTGPALESVPAFSTTSPCIAGTYKNFTGVRPCVLCSEGTKNDGTNPAALVCSNCANDTFCPLGSATDSISNDQLSNVNQAQAYPQSPDITSIDDIIIFTLFSIGSTGRCVALSPIFWTLIVLLIVVIIAILMLVMKHCMKSPKAKSHYKTLAAIFTRADIITAGEFWVGGLATLCFLVLTLSVCIFSALYYNSYPIETAGESTYTCDTALRNAQFSSSIQPSSVPVPDDMKEIIDLLDNQPFTLNVDFINTVYNCTSDPIIIAYQLAKTWVQITTGVACNSSNYILSYNVSLPFKTITVRFYLPNIYTIGGLRIGLSGPGQSKSSTTTLQTLEFSQTFSQSSRTLGQDVNIDLDLTKVINSTSPLVSSGDTVYSGLWINLFDMNYYESFYSNSDYSSITPEQSTNVTLVIDETPYYILNEQTPIARLSEIVFHTFIFITTIIGMFALIFLLFNLLFIPLGTFLIRKCNPDFDKEKDEEEEEEKEEEKNENEKNSTSNSSKEEHESKENIIPNAPALERRVSTPNENSKRVGSGTHTSSRPSSASAVVEAQLEHVIVVRERTDGNRIIKEHVRELPPIEQRVSELPPIT